MIEPRLRVAVVTLGDPEWLHALAEPFNKTLRDRGLGEHCCFMRLSRLSRVKGLTATLRSYILSGTAGYRATVVILDRHVYEAYCRIDAVKRRYAGRSARRERGSATRSPTTRWPASSSSAMRPPWTCFTRAAWRRSGASTTSGTCSRMWPSG